MGVLDIASGLGGIDIILSRHYPGCARFCLIDGWDDPPIVHKHAQTFNDMSVARDFLERNGLLSLSIAAYRAGAVNRWAGRGFDVVLSLQGWCFHFNPETYIELAREALNPKGVLIVDVRREYKTWLYVLEREFQKVAIALETEKSLRVVYKHR